MSLFATIPVNIISYIWHQNWYYHKVCGTNGNGKLSFLVVSSSLSICQTAGAHKKVANYLSNRVKTVDTYHPESVVKDFLRDELRAAKRPDLPF